MNRSLETGICELGIPISAVSEVLASDAKETLNLPLFAVSQSENEVKWETQNHTPDAKAPPRRSVLFPSKCRPFAAGMPIALSLLVFTNNKIAISELNFSKV